MKNISFKSDIKAGTGNGGDTYFNPANPSNFKQAECRNSHFVCCCGYELIKESDTTWRCTGGSHRYQMQEGDVVKDKFGNFLFKVPPGMNKPND